MKMSHFAENSVAIRDLNEQPQYNGKRAIVLSYDEDNDTVTLSVDGQEEPLMVRSKHIELYLDGTYMKWTVYASLKRPTINRSASATRSAKNAPQAFLAKDDSLDFFAYQKSSCSYLLVVVLRHHPSQRVHIISSTDEGSLEGSYRALYEGKIFRKTNKDAKKELEIRLLQECLNRGADRNASTALQDVNNSLGLEFFPTDDIRPGFLHAMSKGLHDLCVEKHRGSEILDLAMIMMDTALRDGASLTHLGRQGCYVGEALVACGDNVNAAKLFEEIADEYLDVGYDDVFLLFGKAMLAWRRAEASLIKILQSTRIDSLKQYRESVIRNFNELHQFYYLMNKESKQIDGEEIKMCLGIKYLTRAALNEAKPEYKQAVAHLIRKGYHDIDEDRAWKILALAVEKEMCMRKGSWQSKVQVFHVHGMVNETLSLIIEFVACIT